MFSVIDASAIFASDIFLSGLIPARRTNNIVDLRARSYAVNFPVKILGMFVSFPH